MYLNNASKEAGLEGPGSPDLGASGASAGAVAETVTTKIPPAIEHTSQDGSVRSIQVNFCKNSACTNYGVPATGRKFSRRSSIIL